MTEERRTRCPDCEADRTFRRAASTLVHLGRKVKSHCPECGYGIVRIDGTVDTATTA